MHDLIGTNARITEMQAVIGIEQLKELNKYILINRNAEILYKYLSCFRFLNLPNVENNSIMLFIDIRFYKF